MSELDIQDSIRKLSSTVPGVRLFRNNVGLFWQGKLFRQVAGAVTLQNARRVRCGLMEGSGDLIGWRTIEITPDMVGRKIAVFTSVEVKRPGERPKANQDNWRRIVSSQAGLAGWATSETQAEEILRSPFRGVL